MKRRNKNVLRNAHYSRSIRVVRPVTRIRRNRFSAVTTLQKSRRRRTVQEVRAIFGQPRRQEKIRGRVIRELKRDARYQAEVREGKTHRCEDNFRKVLSWRADQKRSGGGRARTARERRNNKSQFKRKDC